MLKGIHVPTSITDSSFEDIVSLVLATKQVAFSDDELLLEGNHHILAMHIIVMCEGMIIGRVLIDNGLALNVCPMATPEHLKVDMSLIRPSTMIIRAFGGTHQKVQGEIELIIEISPWSFMVYFQVIKVDSLYNMLLGRPYLHAVGAVLSTIHWRP